MPTTPKSAAQPPAVVQLRVNPITCAAFGFCAEYAPELFALDEWGYAWPHSREVPVALEHLAREAAELCPKRAILLQTPAQPPATGAGQPARRGP